MAGNAQIIVMSERKAQVLAKLLDAFEPIVDDLSKCTVALLGLRMADGSSRTVKIVLTSIEDSAPAAQSTGDGGSLPAGGTDGQVLTKQSSTDGDADWEDLSAGGLSYRELTSTLTVANTLPTTTEISNALAAAYTTPDPALVPADGDFIRLTVSGTPKFVARVTTHSITASGVFVRSFVVNSVTYYATLHQCGLY